MTAPRSPYYMDPLTSPPIGDKQLSTLWAEVNALTRRLAELEAENRELRQALRQYVVDEE